MLPVTDDPPAPDPTIEPKGQSTTSASARDVQPPLLGADPLQASEAKTFASDPAFIAPVIASPQEILYAQELRERLKKRYLNQRSQPLSLWCVGVD